MATHSANCEAVKDRRELTLGILAITRHDEPDIGSEAALLHAFAVLRGIVTEYQDSGDQMAEGCTCAQREQATVEFVTYDPENVDTFPSVCAHPEEVKARFGFEGGETLVFSAEGAYLGHLMKRLASESVGV